MRGDPRGVSIPCLAPMLNVGAPEQGGPDLSNNQGARHKSPPTEKETSPDQVEGEDPHSCALRCTCRHEEALGTAQRHGRGLARAAAALPAPPVGVLRHTARARGVVRATAIGAAPSPSTSRPVRLASPRALSSLAAAAYPRRRGSPRGSSSRGSPPSAAAARRRGPCWPPIPLRRPACAARCTNGILRQSNARRVTLKSQAPVKQ